MVNLFRKIFIKDYKNIENKQVREAHGKLACFVGVFSNLLLFAIKLLIGILAGSIAIIGDSFNNLTDMGSCIVTLLGLHISSKPADEEHPYGHERFEYISSLFVSIIIIVIGIQLFKDSIIKFINFLTNYSQNNFSYLTLIVLGISILIKLWQGLFNRKIGKIIGSISLEATASDSINDMISTTTILIAAMISMIWPKIQIGNYYISVDGLMGIGVSVFILLSGIKLIKETINPLIGIGPDSEFVKAICNDIEAYDGVLGIHDVICHMYGPTTCFMSLHVEVDSKVDINICHELIDNIEHDIHLKHHVEIVIHMDPIDTTSEEIKEYRSVILEIIDNISKDLSIHDFRMVKGQTNTNVIFDCVVPFKFPIKNEEIKKIIQTKVNEIYPNVKIVITFDKAYTSRK